MKTILTVTMNNATLNLCECSNGKYQLLMSDSKGTYKIDFETKIEAIERMMKAVNTAFLVKIIEIKTENEQ